VRRLVAIASCLAVAATSRASAAPDIFLGDSLRQLGLAPLARVAERHGAKGLPTFVAEPNKDYLLVEGLKIYLDDPVGQLRGKLTVTRIDYDKVIVPLAWRLPAARPGSQRILLDPGHGGKDPGKLNAALNYTEKAATLDTALRLKPLLEKLGFEVLLTRDKDVAIDLDDRAPMAAKAKADLFVSLHYNGGAAGDTTSAGIETYCLTPAGQHSTNKATGKADLTVEPGNRFDTFNLQLAFNVQRRILAEVGAEDRGVRRARFAVLRTLTCPGILIEGGFVSSRVEGAQIANAAYRQKLAQAIADGVADYARLVRAK
jgi:N-acetylmuramoyl-L-alanine amidase